MSLASAPRHALDPDEPPGPHDPAWVSASPATRDRWTLTLFRRQVEHLKAEVPFYARRLQAVLPSDLVTLADCAVHVPPLLKAEVRGLESPYALLPRETRRDPSRIFLHRGTGGTTGAPTSVFWTEAEWNAMIDSTARTHLDPVERHPPILAFDNYNQGHISAPAFETLFRRAFRAGIITRDFGADDEKALRQLIRHECNAIIAPGVSTHKGGSLQDLLEADARLGTDHIRGESIHCVLVSSTPLPAELVDELRDLGIHRILNTYGSTDVGGVAASPPGDPLRFDVVAGASCLFVVGADGEPVKDGERGLVVASRLGGYEADAWVPASGSGLLNFHLGDAATYHAPRARDGRTTAGISELQRVMDLEDKLASGCQVW